MICTIGSQPLCKKYRINIGPKNVHIVSALNARVHSLDMLYTVCRIHVEKLCRLHQSLKMHYIVMAKAFQSEEKNIHDLYFLCLNKLN